MTTSRRARAYRPADARVLMNSPAADHVCMLVPEWHKQSFITQRPQAAGLRPQNEAPGSVSACICQVFVDAIQLGFRAECNLDGAAFGAPENANFRTQSEAQSILGR